MSRRKRILSGFLLCLCMLLSGCDKKGIRLVLYTGLGKNEVFRIERMNATLPEVMVYLSSIQGQYEQVYGNRIWEVNLEGKTLEDNIKEMVLAQLSQTKAMNLLASQEKVELTEEENAKVKEAATVYYDSLEETVRKQLQVDKELIGRMYAEYALANKVYSYIIKDINPEVSDDEARTITIEHILIKTYKLDEQGNKIEYTPQEKKEAFQKALEVQKKAKEGISFDTLVTAYNEDSQSQYSFRKGEMSDTFEKAAFNLGKGEISDVVETEYGYHVMKCLTTFNQEETDANKVKIVEKKREAVFEERYTSFAKDLTKALNEKLWNKVTLVKNEDSNQVNFFGIYQQYIGNNFTFD